MSLFNSGCWSKCFHLVGIWKILRIKVTSHHSRKINWCHLYLKIYIFGQHFSAMPFTHSSHNVFSTKDVPEIHQITAKKQQLWLATSFPHSLLQFKAELLSIMDVSHYESLPVTSTKNTLAYAVFTFRYYNNSIWKVNLEKGHKDCSIPRMCLAVMVRVLDC